MYSSKREVQPAQLPLIRPFRRALWIIGSPSLSSAQQFAPFWTSFSTRGNWSFSMASFKGMTSDPSITLTEAPFSMRTDISRGSSRPRLWMTSPSGTLAVSMLVARPPAPTGRNEGPPPPRYRILSLCQSFFFITLFNRLMRRFLGIEFVRADVRSENKSGKVQYRWKLIPKKIAGYLLWKFRHVSFVNALSKKQRSKKDQAIELEV